jgi:hypothetical protein
VREALTTLIAVPHKLKRPKLGVVYVAKDDPLLA